MRRIKKLLFPVMPLLLVFINNGNAQTAFNDGTSGLSVYANASQGYWDNSYGINTYYSMRWLLSERMAKEKRKKVKETGTTE